MGNLIGQMLGRYQIVEQLGEGGMATVYKAFDTTLRRNVAIKVIKSERVEDTSFRKRFEREARALAQLTHPHIVHINDFGEQGGLAYLVMDYLSGGTLKIKMGRPMPYQEAARLLVPMAQALGFAHQKKIVHRDVKPANILLNESGMPMLSDFGIAKLLEGSAETVELTSSGVGVGTPAYMAPEQAGNNFDHRADIYSLGVVFYELVTGRRPYDADTPLATMMKHATEPLPPPRNFVPSLPDVVEQVIFKALTKNPNDRFQSMEEFAQQLEQLQFGNLQSTMARVPLPDTATRIAPATPPPGATVVAPYGQPMPQQNYPQPGTSSVQPRAPVMNLPQTSYVQYPQQAQPQQPVYGQQPPVYGQQPGYGQPPMYAAPAPQKSSAGKWIGGILALAAVAVIVLVIGGGLVYAYWPELFGGTSTAPLSLSPSTETAAALSVQMTSMAGEWATITAQAQKTVFVVSESTRQAGEQASQATQANLSSTEQAASQAKAAEETAAALGKPRVAFLDNNDIYAVGVDGSNFTRLTSNGGDKRNLRWLPDGKGIYYITGKCVQTIDYLTQTETKLFCFNYAQKVTGFEISADGQYVGILVDDNLYLGKYDPEAIKKIYTKSALSKFGTCGYISGVRFFHLSLDNTRVAVTAFAPGEDVVRIHNQGCTKNNTSKLDEFPSQRFRPYHFNDNPIIYSFGWGTLHLFGMVTNYREHSFGYFNTYNSETKVGEQVTPMGTQCCYQAPSWSNDGEYLTFGYIDAATIASDRMGIYVMSSSDLGTVQALKPIPVPDTVLKNDSVLPQPVIYVPPGQ